VTQRYVAYCEARAAGGAALILLESMYVHPAGQNHRYQLGLHDDDLVPGYRRLIAACHRHGALVGAHRISRRCRTGWRRDAVDLWK
jgi:2,4-dienoyl-CoA reductase-like NADH-dependent reductase (Old Yellow Enzyme family)